MQAGEQRSAGEEGGRAGHASNGVCNTINLGGEWESKNAVNKNKLSVVSFCCLWVNGQVYK